MKIFLLILIIVVKILDFFCHNFDISLLQKNSWHQHIALNLNFFIAAHIVLLTLLFTLNKNKISKHVIAFQVTSTVSRVQNGSDRLFTNVPPHPR